MATLVRKGLEQELQYRQEALLAGEGGPHGEARRSLVAQDLQTMFELCYKNGVNPLPDLRDNYPAFSWRFVNKNGWSEDLLLGIAEEAAFIWFLPDSDIVTAKSNENLGNFANTVILVEHDKIQSATRLRVLCRLRDQVTKKCPVCHTNVVGDMEAHAKDCPLY